MTRRRGPLMAIPTSQLPLPVVATVLRALVAGRTRQWAASSAGVSLEQAELIASRNGHPDKRRLAVALAELEQRISEAPDRQRVPAPEPSGPGSAPSKPTLPPPRELRRLPLSALIPDPDNPRANVEDALDEIKASIKEAGLIQAPVVRPVAGGQFMIVAGHRRVAAVRQLGWPSIEVIVNRALRPDDVLAAMLIENGQRRDLDPIEEARALRKIQQQLTSDQSPAAQLKVAHKVGRSLSHVSNRLALLALKPDDQEAVRSGDMTLTEATAKARIVAGRVRPGAIGRSGVGHLAATHPLAGRAKARCIRLGHSRGKGTGVGGIACGQCWETVIRADERDSLATSAQVHGKCPICDTPTTASVRDQS